MKKVIQITILFLAFTYSNNVISQVSKNTWLIGGEGDFRSTNFKSNSAFSDFNNLMLSSDIGYFFIDKLATGLEFEVQFNFFESDEYDAQRYSIGPFLRYYFLNMDKQFNIFSQIDYKYSVLKGNDTKNSSSVYGFKAGSSIFFTKNVALEISLNYDIQNKKLYNDLKYTAKIFSLGIGFQIHLEKINNKLL